MGESDVALEALSRVLLWNPLGRDALKLDGAERVSPGSAGTKVNHRASFVAWWICAPGEPAYHTARTTTKLPLNK